MLVILSGSNRNSIISHKPHILIESFPQLLSIMLTVLPWEHKLPINFHRRSRKMNSNIIPSSRLSLLYPVLSRNQPQRQQWVLPPPPPPLGPRPSRLPMAGRATRVACASVTWKFTQSAPVITRAASNAWPGCECCAVRTSVPSVARMWLKWVF